MYTCLTGMCPNRGLIQTPVFPVMKMKYPWHSLTGPVFHLSASLCKKNPCKGAWHPLSVWEGSPAVQQREASVDAEISVLRHQVISALCQAHFFTATQTLIFHRKIIATTGSAIAGQSFLLQSKPWDHVHHILHQNFSLSHVYVM